LQGTVGSHACNFGGRGQRDVRREKAVEGIDVANATKRKGKEKKGRKREREGERERGGRYKEKEIRGLISTRKGECWNNEREGALYKGTSEWKG